MSFYLILDQAKIHKKYEWFKAEVKFYSFAADENFSLPVLDSALKTQSTDEIRPLILEASKEILNKWEGVTIENVKSDHIFEFGDTGKILYQSAQIPNFLNWTMMVIEQDEDIRQLGQNISEIVTNEDIDSLAGHIMNLSSTAATPQLSATIAITKTLVKGVTFFMKKNKNDQLGLVEQSFIRDLHYPRGKRSADGVGDLTGNMWYDYTLFGTA